LRIVVTGLLAQYPLGGVAWDYLQYVLGLARLGHDVYYLEDTEQWPYDPVAGATARTPDRTVAHLGSLMARFGLADRWAYRFPWRDQWFGMSDGRRREVVASADLLLDVSGTLARPDAYRGAGRLIYIDSDPVFTQLKLARGQADFRARVDAHDLHFSFGERLGDAVPETGHAWLPTRQPIVLDEWPIASGDGSRYTTVMNWTSYAEVRHEGRTYGQKDVEFMRFLDLPARVAPVELECAMAGGKTRGAPLALLRHRGWRVVDPDVACPDLDGYRAYLAGSRGEWSVAKNGYVQGRPGWFSCRSACYLACGRPVIVQDTGFGDVLPVGEGLLSFQDVDGAAAAIDAAESDPARHRRAARAIAEAYFGSDAVLGRLVDRAMAGDVAYEEAAR
jgi:hypothetical protein